MNELMLMNTGNTRIKYQVTTLVRRSGHGTILANMMITKELPLELYQGYLNT